MSRPVFVVGSPRSGTTVVGRFIGSHPDVLDMGEYYGHYAIRVKMAATYRRVPSDLYDEFSASMWEAAVAFPAQAASARGCNYFVDSTPWNLLIADKVAAAHPDAIWVLMVRSYRGVIQSLERSYRDGFLWAGETVGARARVWADLYQHTDKLPHGRTIPVSYEGLCERPGATVQEFCQRLIAMGGPELKDLSAFARPHASGKSVAGRSQMIGRLTGRSKSVKLSPIPSYNASSWSSEKESEARRECATVDRALRAFAVAEKCLGWEPADE